MRAEIGKTYLHYKNKHEYLVVAIGKLERDHNGEEYVVYRAVDSIADDADNPTWIRPRREFEEDVDYEGVLMPRFTPTGL